MGELFPLAVAGLPTNATHATLVYGVRRDQWGSVPLPFDLGLGGLPSCSLYTSVDALQTLALQNGFAAWVIGIPSQPYLLGTEVFEQVFALDLAANPGGVVLSGGLALRLGLR